jgi:hypothetical protein
MSGYIEAERRRPARALNLESDFLVPFSQSIAIGAGVTIGGFYLAWAGVDIIWHTSCFVGLIAAGGWFVLSLGWSRRLLWIYEHVVREDIDGDGYTGPPPDQPEVEPVELVVRGERGKIDNIYRLHTGLDNRRLVKFAIGVTSGGRSLAEVSWTGRGNPFSKAEYSRLLSALEEAGLIEWVNPSAPAQGRQLTGTGRATLSAWANVAKKDP